MKNWRAIEAMKICFLAFENRDYYRHKIGKGDVENLHYASHCAMVDMNGRQLFGESWTPSHSIVAWLHDVLEDTDFTLKDINLYLDLTMEEAMSIDAVSNIAKYDYDTFIQRVITTGKGMGSNIPVMVKYADMYSNMKGDKSEMSDERAARLDAKYNKSIHILAKAINDIGVKFDPNEFMEHV